MIVDAHLDIAHNAICNGRDLTRTVADLRASEQRRRAVAMTSLPDLGNAGVGVVFATLFAEPTDSWSAGLAEASETPYPLATYNTPEEAELSALQMLELYEGWAERGLVRLIIDRATLEAHLAQFPEDRIPGFVISMEGADPIVGPEDLERWWRRGLRLIGLAWGSTRYAGGTGSSQGLTSAGRELLQAMAELGVIHDAAHLSEEAFWEAAGLPQRALCVSHAGAREVLLPAPGRPAYVPLNRHLSDAQIREVAKPHGATSRGVIGITLLNDFLDPSWDYLNPDHEVSFLEWGGRHLRHFASIAGWESVGVGSDIDAGYGRDETPIEFDTVADWPRIAECVPPETREGVLGGNWLRFLREALPQGS